MASAPGSAGLPSFAERGGPCPPSGELREGFLWFSCPRPESSSGHSHAQAPAPPAARPAPRVLSARATPRRGPAGCTAVKQGALGSRRRGRGRRPGSAAVRSVDAGLVTSWNGPDDAHLARVARVFLLAPSSRCAFAGRCSSAADGAPVLPPKGGRLGAGPCAPRPPSAAGLCGREDRAGRGPRRGSRPRAEPRPRGGTGLPPPGAPPGLAASAQAQLALGPSPGPLPPRAGVTEWEAWAGTELRESPRQPVERALPTWPSPAARPRSPAAELRWTRSDTSCLTRRWPTRLV